MERIEPIRFKYEDGTEYILEYNREVVAQAEDEGFVMSEENADKMARFLPELFYYAFKMHHPKITRKETDRILFEDLEGLTPEQIERLGALYASAYQTLVKLDGGKPKNPKLTVVM